MLEATASITRLPKRRNDMLADDFRSTDLRVLLVGDQVNAEHVLPHRIRHRPKAVIALRADTFGPVCWYRSLHRGIPPEGGLYRVTRPLGSHVRVHSNVEN
jgi:hypothetical protein